MKQWKLRYEKSQIIHLFPYILVVFANANCMCVHMPWHTFSSNQRTQMKLWYYPFPPSPFLLLEKRRNSSSYPFCCIIPSSFPWQGEGGVWLSLPTKAVCSWSKSREALNEHELLVICTKSVRDGIIPLQNVQLLFHLTGQLERREISGLGCINCTLNLPLVSTNSWIIFSLVLKSREKQPCAKSMQRSSERLSRITAETMVPPI